MDILLIIYSISLLGILIFPFVYIYNKKEDSDSREIERKNSLLTKRQILLENLRDLKTDMETGKYSREELDSLSRNIIKNLERLDSELESINIPQSTACQICNFDSHVKGAKYCAICGTKLKNTLT
ncbi:MAG: hypothetical protein KDK36_09565 [Leptospiraceae bacterium]|nr:hypothetical protein [Leptospiraceae bacterium]